VPELPEVEVVRRGLEPAVTGSIIESVSVLEPRSLRRHPGPAEDFIERLTGRRLLGAVRRGKFLWLPLWPAPSETQDSGGGADRIVRQAGARPDAGARSPEFPNTGEALVAHLGMSGQLLLRDEGRADDALLRIRFILDHAEHGRVRLDFVDQRIFGSMAIDDLEATADGAAGGLGSEAPLVPQRVAHIARDPLDPAFSDSGFLAALAKRRTGVKRALLDQTLVSGIGNIYADEALWAARIHYEQPTNTLSRARAKTLLAEVRLVLAKALEEGGTSFDAQYLNVNGESGYFSHSLNAYGRHGEPCSRCGRPIVRDSFMNRGSHYCRYCQRVKAQRA
jgi:formamidopyrimidine-DNA glycosylase